LRVDLAQKPSPVRRLRVNAAPTLTPLYDAPDLMLNGADPETIEVRSRLVKADPVVCARVIAAYVSAREPFSRSLHVEEQLYDGFPSRDDEIRMAAFHDASWPETLSIVQSFDDERLRTFGLRLIYFGNRSTLPPAVRTEVERLLTDRLVDEAAGALTLAQALQAIELISIDGQTDLEGLLVDYRTHLSDRLSRVSQFRSKHLGVS
jgi:exodeoxyribonuclease-1